jgi:acetoin utilization deacetylase AcuC-like enzyme
MGLHRVVIIDLDAHSGGGTCRLSRGKEGIAPFDIAGGYVDGVERLHLMTVRAMAPGLA